MSACPPRPNSASLRRSRHARNRARNGAMTPNSPQSTLNRSEALLARRQRFEPLRATLRTIAPPKPQHLVVPTPGRPQDTPGPPVHVRRAQRFGTLRNSPTPPLRISRCQTNPPPSASNGHPRNRRVAQSARGTGKTRANEMLTPPRPHRHILHDPDRSPLAVRQPHRQGRPPSTAASAATAR